VSRFLVCDAATGRPIQVSNCDSSEDAISAFDGGVLAVELNDGQDDSTHYFSIANLVLTAFPERPSPAHRFDYAAERWTDPRSLDELKAAKWAEIKAAREVANSGPKVTSFGTFDATPEDRANIAAVVAIGQTAAKHGYPSGVNFTLADNTRVAFTLDQFENAAMQVGAQVQANFDKADTLRKQIDAATTAAELDLIVW